MNIAFRYYAQVRHAAGMETEHIDASCAMTVAAAIAHVASRHAKEFGDLVCDANGSVRPGIIVLVNGVPADPGHTLDDGDEITLLSPVAGG
jgi:MoaD family protein